MKRVKINKILFVLSLIGLAFMQACVSDDVVAPVKKVLKKGIVKPVKTETLLIQADNSGVKAQSKKRNTNFVNDVWLGDEIKTLVRGQANLPRHLTRHHNLTFITPAMNLPQITDALSSMVEIPIQIVSGNQGQLKLVQKKSVRYKGNVRNLLDMLATNFDAVWRYDRQKQHIIFTRVLTMELSFFVAAGVEQFIKKISTQSSANNSFVANRTVILDPWQELKSDLEKLLPLGSQISLSPTSGKIVLTSTPSAMRDAVKLVRARNKTLQRQLYFNIQLLELKISEEKFGRDSLPLSLSALLKQASDGTLLINGKKTTPQAAKKTATKTKKPPKTTKNKKDLLKPFANTTKTGKKNSLDALLRALNTIGELSVLTSTNSWTRNGKAIPVRNVLQQSYVAQVKDNVLVPAELETSFYLHLLPLILPRDRVQIDLSVSLKSLNEMRNYGTGDNQIQLPQLSTKSWTQEAIIPNDATLLLSGFEVRSTASGIHTIMIILITPQILEPTL